MLTVAEVAKTFGVSPLFARTFGVSPSFAETLGEFRYW